MKNDFFRLFFLLLFCLLSCYAFDPAHLNDEQICSIGKKYVDYFYQSQLELLHSHFFDTKYELSDLQKFRIKVENSLGTRQKFLNEQFGAEPWQYYYICYHRFLKATTPVRTLFTFNENGEVLQYSVQSLPKAADTQFSNYQTKTKLSFPFMGEWFVAWGGRTINENQHIVSREQRFAYDFVIRQGSKTFAGDGKSNQDYFCYKEKVLAPGAGKIIEIYDKEPENKIGQMPQTHGNRIVINHENGEYSVISHFRKGSFTVRVGDDVQAGQLLGLCGNSGHSSEPHIHYHLQNTPTIDNGDGLPIQFQTYLSDGNFIEKGEPKIGEYVQNAK